VATVNHDFGKRLGSTVDGNVRLGTDDVGLAFEIDLPDTDLAKTVRRMVDKGELQGMSFTATVGDMVQSPAGVIHRAFKALREISVVRVPAYAGTVVREAPSQTLADQLVRARFRALLEGKR
jgi:HK97 family phage prohead protease